MDEYTQHLIQSLQRQRNNALDEAAQLQAQLQSALKQIKNDEEKASEEQGSQENDTDQPSLF